MRYTYGFELEPEQHEFYRKVYAGKVAKQRKAWCGWHAAHRPRVHVVTVSPKRPLPLPLPLPLDLDLNLHRLRRYAFFREQQGKPLVKAAPIPEVAMETPPKELSRSGVPDETRGPPAPPHPN